MLITGGRISRFAQKWLGIKGEPVLSDLADDLQASFDVVNLPTELRVLDSVYSFGFTRSIGPTANNNSILGLQNPSGSGVVGVIERWIAWEDAGFDTTLLLRRGTGLNTNPQNGNPRDFRIGKSSTLVTISQTAATTPGTATGRIPQRTPSTATIAIYDPVIGDGRDELIVSPGDDFCIMGPAAAPVGGVALFTSIWWRERPIEPSEQTA